MTDDWSKRYIVIPRWVLQVKYALFVILAGLTAIAGSATLDLSTPTGYTPIWSAAVAFGALVALPCSTRPAWAGLEKWAAAWIAAWLSVIAVFAVINGNGSGWLIVVIVTLLPAGRAIDLFSRRPR